MSLRQLILIGFLLLFSIMQTGCASFNKKLKGWLNGSPSQQSAETKQASTLTKFSESPDVSPRVKRQYKRTTKETLADEAALDSKSGSLWVMEGQGAYLFSQNVVRLVGDPLAVTLEGDPKDQLQSKVTVIKKLLAKIEERQKARLRGLASEDGKEEEDSKDAKSKDKKDKAAEKQAQEKQRMPEPEQPADFNIKTVPTRIVERTLEGNYRVKGTQPVMIGSREYKVIVTGIVKSEDFNEEGIPASKLLDPKFDIVSARRKEGEM
jgi:flagellar L-ring protein precursor FlgH